MLWLKLLKDIEMGILYHLGKTFAVVDCLSKLSMGRTIHVDEGREFEKNVHTLAYLGVRVIDSIGGRINTKLLFFLNWKEIFISKEN